MKHHPLNLAFSASYLAGVTLICTSAQTLVGQLTGQGSSLHGAAPLHPTQVLVPASSLAVLPQSQADTGVVLAMGILLIVAGLLFHALWVAKQEEAMVSHRSTRVRKAAPWSPAWFWKRLA